MNEHWVSYLPKENKREGAYSIGGTAGLKKYYVLMNWNKNIDSIFTLSHELGHSLNSYYTNKKQKIYTHNKIFYAEIASVANEVLTSVYLLEKYKNDKQMKLLILDNLIKDFFATTTRQIIFSNWEYEANKWVNSGEEFSVNKSLELYSKIKEKYTSIKSKKNDENTKKSDSIILRIPHFYHGNFYVYKYAIGQLVAFYVVNKILNNKKDFINQYINFLSSGNSKSPLETIKLLGFEFNDKCINESIQLLKKFIKEYKEL
jgi:oligoendopeptidase F